MERLSAYIRIESKHVAACFLKSLLALLVMAALSAGLVFGVYRLMAAGSESERIRVAMVLPDNGEGQKLRLAASLIAGQESVRSIAAFAYMDEEEARQGLQDGTVQAAIVLGENFLSDVMTGVNTPALVLLPSDSNLNTEVFRELVRDGVSIIETGEAMIYGVTSLSGEIPLTVERSEMEEFLTDLYTQEVLSRGDLYTEDMVSIFGEGSMAQYYFASFLTLLLLFSALSFAGLYSEGDRTLRLCLTRCGIGAFLQSLVRVLLMGAVFFVLCLAGLTAGAVLGLADVSFGGVLLLVLVSLFVSVLAHLVFSLPGETGSHALLWILLVAVMILLSGLLLPAALLPGAVQVLGTHLPVYVIRQAVTGALTGSPEPSSVLTLLLGFGIVFGGGVLCQQKKLCR